ncbi:MAG: rRNA pseudouridine synthase [Clostridiales bacterium]|nr:rRNA pseudouridine synthase [Clostridiales bacterium]
MRLDRLLASSGLGTRSQVRDKIAHGGVSVNGTVVTDASLHVKDTDSIIYDGHEISCQTKLYYLLDKPDGVLTAMEDKRLPCVADYIPSELMSRKLSPVGRLDYHTSGLLIITNDGELSHRLQSPRYEVPKIYLATFRGPEWTENEISTVASGFTINDRGYSEKIAPATLEMTFPSSDGMNRALLTLREGKTHEVRRIFAHFDREVTALRRIGLAGINISRDTDSCGTFRPLTENELGCLLKATAMTAG